MGRGEVTIPAGTGIFGERLQSLHEGHLHDYRHGRRRPW